MDTQRGVIFPSIEALATVVWKSDVFHSAKFAAIHIPLRGRRKITFRICSMLAKQVRHDQVYRGIASHENNKEETNPSMSMSYL